MHLKFTFIVRIEQSRHIPIWQKKDNLHRFCNFLQHKSLLCTWKWNKFLKRVDLFLCYNSHQAKSPGSLFVYLVLTMNAWSKKQKSLNNVQILLVHLFANTLQSQGRQIIHCWKKFNHREKWLYKRKENWVFSKIDVRVCYPVHKIQLLKWLHVCLRAPFC